MTPREMELLSAYHDGETSADESAEVERLLDRDGQARAALAELRQTSSMIAGLPRAHAPDGLAQRVQALAEREALLGPERRGFFSRPSAARAAARWSAIAAAIALMVAGWQLYDPVHREPMATLQTKLDPDSVIPGRELTPAAESAAELSEAMPGAEIASRSKSAGEEKLQSTVGRVAADALGDAGTGIGEGTEVVIDAADREEALTRLYAFIEKGGGTRLEAADENVVAVPGLGLILPGAGGVQIPDDAAHLEVYVETHRAQEFLATMADLRKRHMMRQLRMTAQARDSFVRGSARGGRAATPASSGSVEEVRFRIRFENVAGDLGQPMSQPTTEPAT